MFTLRCRHCGRWGLPPRVGSVPNGELPQPINHARLDVKFTANVNGIACHQGIVGEYPQVEKADEESWDL